jgi:uncharacterized small protein (DUF1192 family)
MFIWLGRRSASCAKATREHLRFQGSDPKIICGDINDLMQRLSVMRDEVMRLVAEDAAKPQDESAPAP